MFGQRDEKCGLSVSYQEERRSFLSPLVTSEPDTVFRVEKEVPCAVCGSLLFSLCHGIDPNGSESSVGCRSKIQWKSVVTFLVRIGFCVEHYF